MRIASAALLLIVALSPFWPPISGQAQTFAPPAMFQPPPPMAGRFGGMTTPAMRIEASLQDEAELRGAFQSIEGLQREGLDAKSRKLP